MTTLEVRPDTDSELVAAENEAKRVLLKQFARRANAAGIPLTPSPGKQKAHGWYIALYYAGSEYLHLPRVYVRPDGTVYEEGENGPMSLSSDALIPLSVEAIRVGIARYG